MPVQTTTRSRKPAATAASASAKTSAAKPAAGAKALAPRIERSSPLGKTHAGAKKAERAAEEIRKTSADFWIKTGARQSRAMRVFEGTDLVRVDLIREGVPAKFLNELSAEMEIPRERLFSALRLPRSTIDRKIRDNERLSPEHSERVIGLERLIGQVEVMVNQSGTAEGFDASRWVGEWLERPLPALGGSKPGDFMDTIEGQQLVSRLLAQAQSGTFA